MYTWLASITYHQSDERKRRSAIVPFVQRKVSLRSHKNDRRKRRSRFQTQTSSIDRSSTGNLQRQLRPVSSPRSLSRARARRSRRSDRATEARRRRVVQREWIRLRDFEYRSIAVARRLDRKSARFERDQVHVRRRRMRRLCRYNRARRGSFRREFGNRRR